MISIDLIREQAALPLIKDELRTAVEPKVSTRFGGNRGFQMHSVTY